MQKLNCRSDYGMERIESGSSTVTYLAERDQRGCASGDGQRYATLDRIDPKGWHGMGSVSTTGPGRCETLR